MRVQVFNAFQNCYVNANQKSVYKIFHSLLGKLDIKLKSDNGLEIPLDVINNEDGTYLVDYVAPSAGDYTLNCRYEGVQIPQCPLKIRVPPNVDVSKIKVDGLETSKFICNFYFFM